MASQASEEWVAECVAEFIREHCPEEGFLIPSLPRFVRRRASPAGARNLARRAAVRSGFRHTAGSALRHHDRLGAAVRTAAAGHHPDGAVDCARDHAGRAELRCQRQAHRQADRGAEAEAGGAVLRSAARIAHPRDGRAATSCRLVRLEPAEVDKRFRSDAAAAQYVLRVDEPRLALWAGNSGTNLWHELPFQPQRMLGLVLVMFRTGVLQFAEIDEKVLLNTYHDEEELRPKRSRIKKQLCDRLNCGLHEVIRASEGRRRYERYGVIPYYWIRAPGASLLLER